MATVDDFRPSFNATRTKDGVRAQRTIQVRAETAIDALNDSDSPQRGDALDAGEGSLSEIIYCSGVTATQLERGAGDDAAGFWFDVTATYEPLTSGSGTNPVVNKATWKVGFRPQSINIKKVNEEADQTDYGNTGAESTKFDDVGMQINLVREGPQGVNIDEMVEVLQIDFWKEPDDVEDYVADVRSIVDTINAAEFSGPWGTYDAGEAKIAGLEIQSESAEIVTVSVQIERRPNRIGDASSGNPLVIKFDTDAAPTYIDRRGHDYFWIRYTRTTDPNNADKVIVRSIDGHVAKVYEDGDFSLLGVSDSIFV